MFAWPDEKPHHDRVDFSRCDVNYGSAERTALPPSAPTCLPEVQIVLGS